ncbi:MAG: tetratricopeptide repeat protein [Bdellovibrionota bacterium]
MINLAMEIKNAISGKLQQSISEASVIEVVPIPVRGNRVVRLRTIEEIIADFNTVEDNDSFAYLVRIRPTKTFDEHPSDIKSATLPNQPQNGIYFPNGKLNIPFLTRNAELLFTAGDYTLSRNIYKAISKAGECTDIALYWIGRCHEAEGKLELAKTHYEESLAYRPMYETYKQLYSLLIKQAKNHEAAEIIERCLKLSALSDKQQFELHEQCGKCWSMAGKTKEAEAHLKLALEIEPGSDEINEKLGEIYLQAGRINEAKIYFQKSSAANPKNAKTLAGLGHCFLSDGEKKKAHEFLAKSLSIEINNPSALFNLVKCAFELKTYATAALIVEDYIKTAPVNSSLLYSLAGLQFHLGRLSQAKITTQKILELAPEHSGAKELLSIIDMYIATPT